VTFSLDRGLPEHAWLWLKNGTRWLDYRSIDPGSGWTGDLARAGVDIAVPSDPRANVAALLAAGEGPQLEYKRQLPADAGRSGGCSRPSRRLPLATAASWSSGSTRMS
jgi:hypothetical protein